MQISEVESPFVKAPDVIKQTIASKYPPTPGTQFKRFTSKDIKRGKTMTRMRKVEEDSDKTKIEMRGMKEEMSECKRNIERITVDV